MAESVLTFFSVQTETATNKMFAMVSLSAKPAPITFSVKQTFHAEYSLYGHTLLHANQEEKWDHFVSQIMIASLEIFAGNCPLLMTKCVLKNTMHPLAHSSSGIALSIL